MVVLASRLGCRLRVGRERTVGGVGGGLWKHSRGEERGGWPLSMSTCTHIYTKTQEYGFLLNTSLWNLGDFASVCFSCASADVGSVSGDLTIRPCPSSMYLWSPPPQLTEMNHAQPRRDKAGQLGSGQKTISNPRVDIKLDDGAVRLCQSPADSVGICFPPRMALSQVSTGPSTT